MPKTIAFVVNIPSYFISHRLPIAIELIQQGFNVHLITSGPCPPELKELKLTYHNIEMSRKGKNPFTELAIVFSLYRLFKAIKPDLVHLVTIKPYLYGGIAARAAGVPCVVSAVAGLGTLFIERSSKYTLLRAILWPIYHFAFNHPNQILIFQNTDDQAQIIRWLNASKDKTILIRGSGVDLKKYTYHPEPNQETAIVALASRLLKDKGVVEYVNACKELQQRGVKADYWLVGTADEGNANTITKAQLDLWKTENVVKQLGHQKNIAKTFKQCHLVVLPSYREGLPKVLVEAAACGRAVVTTDVPGCRDAITPNVTGVLVPVRNSQALANAMQLLIEEPEKRKKMGAEGRRLAEKEFCIKNIVTQHLEIYQKLLKRHQHQ